MTNQNAKHTPGPWKLCQSECSRHDGDRYVYGQGPLKGVICSMNGGPNDDSTVLANARLIAAAPEMYQALIAIREAFYVENSPKAVREAMKLSDVVKKADGRI